VQKSPNTIARIAFITPEFVTNEYFSGGLANYVHRVSRVLAEMGHEVHVITLVDQSSESFLHGKVRVHPIVVQPRKRVMRLLIRRFLVDAGQWISFSYKAWHKLSALHCNGPFDLVQVANYRACGLFTCALSKVPCVTRISSLQNVWNNASGKKRHLGVMATEWLEMLQLRLSKNIHAPSRVLAGMVEREAGKQKVDVIRTPFYLETENEDKSLYLRNLHGKKYLLFFGRYDVHKGFEVLTRALPEVLTKLEDCHAVFVGKDGYHPSGMTMREYALSLCDEHAQRMLFFDQQPHEILYPVIAGARLVALPSLVDNLPNAMLEAMALGRLVIGTIGSSFDEVITDGVNGFLVPIGDSDALAKTIIRTWSDPNLDRIGHEARRKVEEFKPEITVKQLLYYYQSIINHDRKVKLATTQKP
jgi:glycosyltransferase involved in cell wall biosynthesis